MRSVWGPIQPPPRRRFDSGTCEAEGRPFLFPSLGPTAFALAFQPGQHQARDVLGGHLCGVLGGLIAYTAIADGTVLTALPPAQSEAAARMAGSGVLSVGLTTAGMLGTRAVHAPACATTLIVSLGLLPTLQDGALIVASVTLLYGVDAGGAGHSPHIQEECARDSRR